MNEELEIAEGALSEISNLIVKGGYDGDGYEDAFMKAREITKSALAELRRYRLLNLRGEVEHATHR